MQNFSRKENGMNDWVLLKIDNSGELVFINMALNIRAFFDQRGNRCYIVVGDGVVYVVEEESLPQFLFETGLYIAIEKYIDRAKAESILANVVEALRALPEKASTEIVEQVMSPLKDIWKHYDYYKYYLSTCLNFDGLFFDGTYWVYTPYKVAGSARYVKCNR